MLFLWKWNMARLDIHTILLFQLNNFRKEEETSGPTSKVTKLLQLYGFLPGLRGQLISGT